MMELALASAISVLIEPTNEELVIAQDACRLTA